MPLTAFQAELARDPKVGFVLHPIDLAVNKLLALPAETSHAMFSTQSTIISAS